MKGIILAGGSATRLYPNTAQISKQLLPIYNVPMVFYPLNILIKAGIEDILVIVSPAHSGRFTNLLEPMFRDVGIRILSTVQEVPKGIADAFIMGEGFIGKDAVTLILGDNIFQDTTTISSAIKDFQEGGHIFAKKVPDPKRFGVATINDKKEVIKITEKPRKPQSDLAVTGAYIYDNKVVSIAKKLKPSARGELEITDINNTYLKEKKLKMSIVKGAWLDAGTPDAYLDACILARKKKLYESFDPIILKAIEIGKRKFKKQAKKLL